MGHKSSKKGYKHTSRSRTKKAMAMRGRHIKAKEIAAKQSTPQILLENSKSNNLHVIKIHNKDSDVVQKQKIESLFIRDETNETVRGHRNADCNAWGTEEEYNRDNFEINQTLNKESDMLDVMQEIKVETLSTQNENDDETLCPRTADLDSWERNEEYVNIKTEEVSIESDSLEAPTISGSRNFNLYEISKCVNMALRHGRRCAAGELCIYNEARNNAFNEITYKCSMCHYLFSIPTAE